MMRGDPPGTLRMRGELNRIQIIGRAVTRLCDLSASASVMRDVCRDLGVPFLHHGLDVADRRYSTVDEIKGKLLRFFTAMGLV